MIDVKLRLQDYCENCPYIKPETRTVQQYADNGTDFISTIVISCENDQHCDWLYKHLKKEATVPFTITSEGTMYGMFTDSASEKIREMVKDITKKTKKRGYESE